MAQLGDESIKVGNQHIINKSQTINDKSSGSLVENEEQKAIEKVALLAKEKFFDEAFNAEGSNEQNNATI